MGKYDKKNVATGGGNPAPRGNTAELNSNPEFQKIASWLASVRFAKKAVGGLDPEDVWKKIDELNTLYENALIAERTRYNVLLRQVIKNAAVSRSSEDPDGI